MIPNIIAGFVSTLLATLAVALYVAHVKVARLRLELDELAEILKKIQESRFDKNNKNQAEELFVDLTEQTTNILNEIAAMKENIFSVPSVFKKKFHRLDRDVRNLVTRQKPPADFFRLLVGDSNLIETEFRQNIRGLIERAEKLSDNLTAHSLLIP